MLLERQIPMNENIDKIMEESLNSDLIQIVLSNGPSNYDTSKIKVRPVLLKEQIVYQASSYKGKQIFHQNFSKEELINEFSQWINNCMKQVLISTNQKESTILISKKGKITIKSRNINNESSTRNISLSHNRAKTYILSEGIRVPFLVDLGVMTSEGKIVHAKYDKFKQINRYLEFIEDILPNLDKDRELTIIDFGCGKSYLTFAMYYYLRELKGYNIKIIGLDLKVDVIKHCSELAKKYGYDKLVFLEGDIASYTGVNKVDMVVTLHACDTATDYALAKAVEWEAKVILSVPCCQHELNGQIENDVLNPLFKYGLIKERMAALATDGIRAQLLEIAGYKTGVLEFIDMEHTPKNILIRGVRKNTSELTAEQQIKLEQDKIEKLNSYLRLSEFLNVKPKLYELLLESNQISI